MPFKIRIDDVPKKLVRRQPKPFQALHEAADRIEPRTARAFLVSTQRLKAKVMISDLTIALSLMNPKRALRQIPLDTIRDVLEPLATIMRDAFVQGGKLAAKQVREQ